MARSYDTRMYFDDPEDGKRINPFGTHSSERDNGNVLGAPEKRRVKIGNKKCTVICHSEREES